MNPFSTGRLDALFSAFSGKTVMVIGDLMLDRYLWGKVSRISPEAPVPVVEIESESSRLGGAANVAYNVLSLGARAVPLGIVGNDSEGELLKRMFREKGFPTEGILTDADRFTTVKTRVIAHHQHVVRTDREIRKGISKEVQDRLMDHFESRLDSLDGIILEDYNKGLLIPEFIGRLIARARQKGKMVFVDPKYDHFFEYRGVTLFKPNRKEASDRLGLKLDSEDAFRNALKRLMDELECRAVLITLGEEGMILQERGREILRVPTLAAKVHDVSGAGDTVIAVMAVVMSAGGSAEEAALIANQAAGIVCGEVGIVPIDKRVLYQKIAEEASSQR
jgi:D-glycero-beta-D-manno-heptose-7-phosphate kinase